MGLVRISIRRGRYVDFASERARDAWGVSLYTLRAAHPTHDDDGACAALGRNVRTVADFLRAPSARTDGDNVPLFIAGREDAELELALVESDPRRETPPALQQSASEAWD
jgi:hypothetical protein